MNPLRQIEVLMTLALGLYVMAFFIARKKWLAHVILALAGFTADMYATYLMWRVGTFGEGFNSLAWWIQVHTLLSLLAILIFIVQAKLGLSATMKSGLDVRREYGRKHALCAKWVFLPIWAVAYTSGFLLPLFAH